jgi:Tol biopolymer transport system component
MKASLILFAAALSLSPTAFAQSGSLGVFESQSDVGSVTPPGALHYDSAAHTYTIDSSGANLWSTTDAFHFAWKKVSGDVAITADLRFPETPANANPHRKALLMFRQDLAPNSAYADAALHGSGYSALQYRPAAGDTTLEIAVSDSAPQTLRLEKRGDTLTLYISRHGEPLHPSGAAVHLHLAEPFYAGIGVCSHDEHAVERAAFTHLALQPLEPLAPEATLAQYSSLQTISINPDARRANVVLFEPARIEAPNWTRDGKSLIFTRDGRLWTIPATGGAATPIDIGDASDCTGSHGLSPDGKWLAMTCTTPAHPGRRVYIVPATGGSPRMVTENPNSYFHSWSPDGKTIAFTRPGPVRGSGNIYAISPDGGPETALTTGSGVSDDPDYSPDGQYIYFNSDRSGAMEIWRMRPDGSHPEQLTRDAMNSWTPHPSPDGKSVLFLSYLNGVTGHPANKDVMLRILTPADGKVRNLAQIVGGSGSDNVPNWAPDGDHFAFVSYQFLPETRAGSTP